MAIVASPRLAARSRVVGYNLKLQMRTIVRDIYTYAEGIYNRKNQSFPEGSIKIKVKDSSNSWTTITMKDLLRRAGVGGQTAAVGTEEPPTTFDILVGQANWRKVIPKPGYGYRKLEADKYKLYEQHEDDLTPWGKEEHGYCIREGILERYDHNMVDPASDTAAQCTQWWHPNMFVPGNGLYTQPAFNRNRAIHTNNICQALVNTGGFGQFAARTLTAPVLEDVSNWCLNPRRLRPLAIPGMPTGKGFVCTVSEVQAGLTSNPTYVANNLGSQWISYNQLNDKLIMWPGVIGRYNNLLIVVDDRQPTLLPGGSAAPYSMTAGYMVWGNRDLRNRTSPNVKDTMFIHGEGHFAEVEGEPAHMIDDDRDYKFHLGVGIAGVRGDQLCIYLDPNSNNVVCEGGAVAILDFPNAGGQS